MSRLAGGPEGEARMAATIAIVVGVLGVGLAASQLFRLKTWLGRPPAQDPSDTTPGDPPS